MARFYNRGWRRSWFRRGYSSASKRGNATFTCRIPLEEVVEFKIPASAQGGTQFYWSQLVSTCPYATYKTNVDRMNYTKGSLLDSYLYRTYTKIYDQVKVNAVSVSIGLMEGVGIGGSLSALRLYTNWERDLKWEEITGTAVPTTPVDLGTGSESQSYLIVNNSRQTFKRYIAARDLQERTTYHDCSYTVWSQLTQGATTVRENYWGDDAWAPFLVGNNTNATSSQSMTYGHSAQCGFVPSLMMAIWSPTTFAAERVVPVSIKVTYSVTFRMPKFGLSSVPGRGVSMMAMDAVEEVKREAGEIEDEKVDDEVPVLKKKKVVYEEEMVPDDEEEEDDEESQEPMTQQFKSPMKKAGKKVTS